MDIYLQQNYTYLLNINLNFSSPKITSYRIILQNYQYLLKIRVYIFFQFQSLQFSDALL